MAKTHTSFLDEIVHDHEKFEVYIGLAGDTGMPFSHHLSFSH
jgi:hypothetical protein